MERKGEYFGFFFFSLSVKNKGHAARILTVVGVCVSLGSAGLKSPTTKLLRSLFGQIGGRWTEVAASIPAGSPWEERWIRKETFVGLSI